MSHPDWWVAHNAARVALGHAPLAGPAPDITAPPRPTPPPLAVRAGNLAAALAAHAADGFASVDDAEQGRRLALCRACPAYLAEHDQCARCGCGMDRKARWRSSSCPDGQW